MQRPLFRIRFVRLDGLKYGLEKKEDNIVPFEDKLGKFFLGSHPSFPKHKKRIKNGSFSLETSRTGMETTATKPRNRPVIGFSFSRIERLKEYLLPVGC